MTPAKICKDILRAAITGCVVGGFCYIAVDQIKIIRGKLKLREMLIQILEACHEERVNELNQSLEALEKEIKESQNNELLRLHEVLVENIKTVLKKYDIDIPCQTTSL